MSFAEDREFEDPEDDFFDFGEVVVELINGVGDPDVELSDSGDGLLDSSGAYSDSVCRYYKAFFMISICSRHALLLVPPVAFLSSTARS